MDGPPPIQPLSDGFSVPPREVPTRARRAGLWAPGQRVLVAFSGGADSLALLHLLATQQEEAGLAGVVAAHVDHGLRPDSPDDARAAEALARRLGVPFLVRRVAVRAEPGIQAGARRARYEALEAMRREAGCDLVATGHTLDDQAETLLLRLARGTSPRGLRGIPAIRGRIVRPLLATRREALEAWCRAHDLAWRSDPSNEDPRYQRVRVRREVLPLLARRLNPEVAAALARLAAVAADEDAWIEGEVDRWAEPAGDLPGGLDCAVVARAPRPLARRLLARAWASVGEGLRADALEDLLQLCRSPAGARKRLTLPGGVMAERSMGRLFLSTGAPPPPPAAVAVTGPGELDLGIAGRLRVESAGSSTVAGGFPSPGADGAGRTLVVPRDAGPLWVRTARPGDRLRGGSRVARVLSRGRVPAPLRSRVPVVVAGTPDGDDVVWIPAHAVGEGVGAAEGRPAWRLTWSPQ